MGHTNPLFNGHTIFISYRLADSDRRLLIGILENQYLCEIDAESSEPSVLTRVQVCSAAAMSKYM